MVKVYLNDPIADSALGRLRAHVELVDNFDHPEELDAIIGSADGSNFCEGSIPLYT